MAGGRVLGRIGREAAWAPVALLLLHAIAARLFGHEPYVDPVMHALGGAAVAFFLRRSAGIAEQIVGTASPLALDLLAFGLTCAVGIVREIGEFLAVRWLGSRTPLGLDNTLRDLVLDGAGAIALLIALRARPESSR